jgi:periplasmic copper chaperone A
MSSSTRPHRGLLLLVGASAASFVLAACAAGAPAGGAPAAGAATAPAAVAPQASVTVSDPWVKTAESGMTAVFGSVSTSGSAPLTVVSARTSASPRTELHEVVMGEGGSMVMQPREDGFVLDPGVPHVLAPGGDHIMIMDLASPIRPGDEVEVTLTLSDGTTAEFTALGKETSGGEEDYGDHAAGTHVPGEDG